MEKQSLYSITEVARLYGIKTDRLRHYDKIGLLKPTWRNPDTGVRYYSLAPEHDRLGTILELRELGLSLEEIAEYFDNRNLKKSQRAFARRRDEIDEDIERLQELRAVVDKKASALSAALEQDYAFGQVRVCTFPVRYVVATPCFSFDIEGLSQATVRLSQRIREVAPLTGSDRIGISFIENEGSAELMMRAGILLGSQDEVSGGEFETLDEGAYVCMHRYGSPLDVEATWAVLKEYAVAHSWTLASELIELFLVDQSVTDVAEETIYDVQVRILSNEPA